MKYREEEFLSSLGKGKIHPLYLFLGEEYPQEKALKELKKAVIGGKKGFDFEVFFADEFEPQKLMNSAETFPIEGEKRLIFLKRVELLPKDKEPPLLQYLKEPLPPFTILVLCGQRLERSQKLYTTILENGVVVEFWPPFKKKIPRYLRNIAKMEGKELDEEVASLLFDLKGADLRGLINELEKLIIYVGKKPIITSKDVLEECGRLWECSVFDLLEAVRKKDIKKSLKRLRLLLLGGEAPLKILHLLIQEFCFIYEAKFLLWKGKEESEIKQALNILSKKRFTEILKSAFLFELREIEKAFYLLLEAEKELKSQGKILHPLTLDLLLLRLCRAKAEMHQFCES